MFSFIKCIRMESLNILFAVVFILHIFEVYGAIQYNSSRNGLTGNELELRDMLNTVMEQNRKLVLQNNRLQQVWFGMQQMCKALAMPVRDCDQCSNMTLSGNKSYAPEKNENQYEGTPANATLPLEVLSIKSTGLTSIVTKISITYVASPEHNVYWIGLVDDGRTWRNGGTRTQSTPGNEIYTSTVDVMNLTSFRTIYFRLSNEKHVISIVLNTTAAETIQEQSITQPHSKLIEMNTSYMAPQNSSLTITGVLKLNMSFIGDSSTIVDVFEGLNTSSNPPTFFEKSSFNSDEINVNLTKRTNETTNYHITIGHSVIKYGGFLTIRVPYMESSKDRMVDVYSSGYRVKIFAYGTKDVLPYNVVGTLPLQNQTVIFPPSSTIMCLTIGNPRPNASIFKIDKNGGFKKLLTETVFSNSYSTVEVLTLSANQRTHEGRYICSASNGNKVVESETDVVIIKKAVIDETKTGVLKNSSNTIVVSCKAKGKPRPELEFRLYDEQGPFMIRSGLFKFRKSESGKYSSRITLTLSASNDTDVHTVYCFAAQGDERRHFEISKKIRIFPEGRENNWDLYQRVSEAQDF